ETEQIKERSPKAAVSRHSGLLVPRNSLAQKDDFKKLLIEEYCPDDEIQKLETEFWNHKMVGSNIDGYTTRFHKLARTGRNFSLTAPEQGQGQRRYVGPHSKCAKCNFHHSGNCPEIFPKVEQSQLPQEEHRSHLVPSNQRKNPGNNRNRAQGRAFALGVAEAPQDPNVVTDMDWLSKLRAKIVCFEKIVQIPLSNKENLEVHGERPKRNLKQLKTMKVKKSKLEDIPIVHDFPGVFLEDLLGLPPPREVEFHIDLIPRAMHVVKLPYHLASTEMQELSNQLKELQDKDDEPMWAADHVVAPTPVSAITIPETANEFAIKGNHLTIVKGNQFDGKTKTDHLKHIHEFLGICDMFKYRNNENEAVRLMMFPLSLTGEAKTWLDELNGGTIETWDELRTTFISRFFPLALFDRLLGEIRASLNMKTNL
ncbi:putative reverse transcriptase domain-containing protein, partial [Tanacetum coccineum]